MQSQMNQDYCYGDQGLVCPSFSTYSTEADTAAKVCREFANLGLVDEELEYEEHDQEVEEDDGFEFVSFQRSADEVVVGEEYNNSANIGHVFPVFNRDLIKQRDHTNDEEATSSASSDVDELDRVPAGSYCVWMPRTTPASSPTHCKKSNSTGTSSSKKWRLRDLLRRSNSEGGKDSFVLLTPSLTSSSSKNINNKQTAAREKMVTTTTKKKKKSLESRPNGPNAVSMAHEVFYAKSKEKRELGFNKRRQSFLPYKRDLVGFFASVNAMGGRTFPTF